MNGSKGKVVKKKNRKRNDPVSGLHKSSIMIRKKLDKNPLQQTFSKALFTATALLPTP